jgi:hypothetical protein
MSLRQHQVVPRCCGLDASGEIFQARASLLAARFPQKIAEVLGSIVVAAQGFGAGAADSPGAEIELGD